MLMQELTLREVFERGNKMKDEEVSRLVQLAVSHLQALQDSDKSYREDEFYNNVKEVRLFSILSRYDNVGYILTF